MAHPDIQVVRSNGVPLSVRINGIRTEFQSEYQRIIVADTEEFGWALFLNDDIQCSESDRALYDNSLLTKLAPSDRRLLILGGGDGMVAETALGVNPNLDVTLVDLDEAVIATCRTYLDQHIYEDPRMTVVVDDALRFLEQADPGTFDGVVVDLTDEPIGADLKAFQIFIERLLLLVHEALAEGGWLSIYAGCEEMKLTGDLLMADLYREMMSDVFTDVEQLTLSVPSFGELCFMSFGRRMAG